MKLIWLFITIGGAIGGYIPVLLGADGFSGWSILGTAVGSFTGIWVWKRLDLDI
jgi:hypothetical protein